MVLQEVYIVTARRTDSSISQFQRFAKGFLACWGGLLGRPAGAALRDTKY